MEYTLPPFRHFPPTPREPTTTMYRPNLTLTTIALLAGCLFQTGDGDTAGEILNFANPDLPRQFMSVIKYGE